MTRIGVLGLQGAVREHVRSIEENGAEAVLVKWPEQLADVDGLILPGGESTTMRRLIDRYGFLEPLRAFGESGRPMFGTCAGLILLAGEVVGYEEPHLGLMNITVERNSFGRQKESFEADLSIKGVADLYNAVFIRAPHIVAAGEGTDVLSEWDGRIVMARDRHYLGCSFHPELTDDHRITRFFIGMAEEAKASLANL
ncbi:pyridoxal 5'-phosphate synthase glutaminase subunit PdxT [Domibacillus enclensis]|uniref:Pyridoxal 5'-phosphate synthase subunit PdxT n=1 Tax=Domibacillus enclensis TaxID=1017273 RepID=A0A1N7CZM3_9BACI|nr:pyridoxal 5'-phosphate synthase glutaminase subunit PdxT [Domibacillus enclensis]OXS73112.1 pyridoxal 5'-phosphate synthase glutaminase subunit PdxT [Domibacillus enclensis]SIR68895.1 pyridoxal phosphate synthase yaaE subunit [Domibacillus enclensis]